MGSSSSSALTLGQNLEKPVSLSGPATSRCLRCGGSGMTFVTLNPGPWE